MTNTNTYCPLPKIMATPLFQYAPITTNTAKPTAAAGAVSLAVATAVQLNFTLGAMLQARGEDLYRMKGILAIRGLQERYIFQVSTSPHVPEIVTP